MNVDRPDAEAHDPEAGGVPPLTKLVSRIPPPPRLPRVDGIKLVAATVHDAAVESGPSAARKRRREHSRPPHTRSAEAVQAWGAALAALCAGAIVVWSSYAPDRRVLELRPALTQLTAAERTSPAASAAAASPPTTEGVATWLDQGDRLQAQHRYAEAEARYLLALERDPGASRALSGLCRNELARKDGARALLWAGRLLVAAPGVADTHLLLGDAQALQGHILQARYAWYRARELGSLAAIARLDASTATIKPAAPAPAPQ